MFLAVVVMMEAMLRREGNQGGRASELCMHARMHAWIHASVYAFVYMRARARVYIHRHIGGRMAWQ